MLGERRFSPPLRTGTEWVYVPDIQSNVHFSGNWGYIQAWQTWVFVPPGNFQSGEGHALLVNAHCGSEGAVTEKRQSERGIQLPRGCSEAPH